MQTALYNDIEPYSCALIKQRVQDQWLPAGEVSQEDIRTLCKKDLSIYGQVHLFCGIGGFALACRIAGLPDDFPIFTAGFPCQPFSNAGQRAGADDARYLWPQTFTAFKTKRPYAAIFENVVGLANMGFPSSSTLMDIKAYCDKFSDYIYRKKEPGVLHQICEDITQEGYSVQVFIIPASATDAPHKRSRVWIVAIKNDDVADSKGIRLQGFKKQKRNKGNGQEPFNELFARCGNLLFKTSPRQDWPTEPSLGRMVNGLPGRLDRVKGLGNAIVPQVAAEIIRMIYETMEPEA